MASIFAFTRKRDHLRGGELEAIPATAPPTIVHRSAGELIGAKVDEMIKSSNRVVDLECDLERARQQLRADQMELMEAVKALGMPADVTALIAARRGE